VPRITALRGRPGGRVEVELDGERWRTLSAEVVLAAGLAVDAELDRERARRLNQELRRHAALSRAAGALARRALSERELERRLARSGIPPRARADAVSRLADAGALDDALFARSRAEVLAERGGGDALIRHDLEARGVAPEVVDAAVSELEPEPERAKRVVRARGASLKTARYLARKGFSQDSIETACGEAVAEDAPPAVR
jgi:regulatory protein